MRLATQLAVFLENRPGTLARVCDALGEAGINILAITTSDTVDHTVVRMVVSEARKAIFLLEERGTLVAENEVVLFEGRNQPGSLAAVARLLAEQKINIEYLYSATDPKEEKGLMVMRVSEPARALRVLQRQQRRQPRRKAGAAQSRRA